MTVTVRASALRGLVDAHFAQRSYVATQAKKPGEIRHCRVTDLGGTNVIPSN